MHKSSLLLWQGNPLALGWWKQWVANSALGYEPPGHTLVGCCGCFDNDDYYDDYYTTTTATTMATAMTTTSTTTATATATAATATTTRTTTTTTTTATTTTTTRTTTTTTTTTTTRTTTTTTTRTTTTTTSTTTRTTTIMMMMMTTTTTRTTTTILQLLQLTQLLHLLHLLQLLQLLRRSAIHASQQFTSSIVFYLWNFRHRLVRYYWYNYTQGVISSQSPNHRGTCIPPWCKCARFLLRHWDSSRMSIPINAILRIIGIRICPRHCTDNQLWKCAKQSEKETGVKLTMGRTFNPKKTVR